MRVILLAILAIISTAVLTYEGTPLFLLLINIVLHSIFSLEFYEYLRRNRT